MAVIALTVKAGELAAKIAEEFPEAMVYLWGRDFQKLKDVVPDLWSKCRALVFIMAAGIAVRQIAPLIESKDRDPAVIVVDESGRHVIPILSGHLGGANALAKILAAKLQAEAVITTATDLCGFTAPDEYARRLGWKLHPLSKLSEVNSRLLSTGKLKVYSELPLPQGHPLRTDPCYTFTSVAEEADIRIGFTTDDDRYLYFLPPVCSVGLGCRKGVSAGEVLEAIHAAFAVLGYSLKTIKGLYSISLKVAERGLQEAAQALGVDFRTFTPEQIQRTIEENDLSRSHTVRQRIGVDGVCEPAALLGCREGELVLPKTKRGKVTLAVCRERFIS